MLSEQLVSGTREVVAIAYSITTHLGLHIPTQAENAIICKRLIHDVTAAVMVKEVAKGNYAIERLKHREGRFLPSNSRHLTNLLGHRTFITRLWEDSICTT